MNGNNNEKWCSTTFDNQNKQQGHVWFMRNHDDEILILQNKLLMKKNCSLWWSTGRQIRRWASWYFSSAYRLYTVKYWLFYFSFTFICDVVRVARRRYWNQSIFCSLILVFANYFGNKKLLDISRGLHKKRITNTHDPVHTKLLHDIDNRWVDLTKKTHTHKTKRCVHLSKEFLPPQHSCSF